MLSRIELLLESEQRRSKKIEQLTALLRDEDISDFVQKLLGEPQGLNGQGLSLFPTNGHPESVAPQSAVSGHVQPGGNPNPHNATGVTIAIRKIGPVLPKPFTITDLADQLKARGFEFTRDPLSAVRDALYFIVRDTRSGFRIVEHGRGGRLSRYEYVEPELRN